MCGVPHHAASNYISRLIRKGYRVAICEQTETPTKGTKLVKREVVRVITPGTAIDPQLMEAREPVYLAAICGSGDTLGVAFLDISSGTFLTTEEVGPDCWQKVRDEVESFAPRELLYPRGVERLVVNTFGSGQDAPTLFENGDSTRKAETSSLTLTPVDDGFFNCEDAVAALKQQMGVRELGGFGLDGRMSATGAAGACLRYAQETQRASAGHISEIKYYESSDFMVLDAVTLRNLEIFESRGEKGQEHTLRFARPMHNRNGLAPYKTMALTPVGQTQRDTDAAVRSHRTIGHHSPRQTAILAQGRQ
jgi:DNA mismatch repair protein MutS